MKNEAELRDHYVDFKGWRFTEPFRCLCCGMRIAINQFCFGRCCGPCDCGRCQHPRYSGSFSGPRQLIDRDAQYFISEDRWLNPPSGLESHHHDGTFDEREAMMQRLRDKWDAERKAKQSQGSV